MESGVPILYFAGVATGRYYPSGAAIIEDLLELLDGAHIVSYAEGGTHLVTNGMSKVQIHHAAYDLDIVGVRPDGVAEVPGPMCWRKLTGRCSSTGCRRCTGSGFTCPVAGDAAIARWAGAAARAVSNEGVRLSTTSPFGPRSRRPFAQDRFVPPS